MKADSQRSMTGLRAIPLVLFVPSVFSKGLKGPKRHKRQDKINRHQAHRGFTLVEILAALVLTAMLVSAVFGAMHQQWKLRTTGETQVEQSQVVRGIVADITEDLRTIQPMPFVDQDEATTPHNGSLWQKPTAIRASDLSEQLLNVARHVPKTPLRFVGEAHWLVIETSQTNSRFHPQTEKNSAGESQQVLWFCSHGESLRVPVARERERLLRRSISGRDRPLGLTRVELPDDERTRWGSDSLTLDDQHWFAIATEVSSLRFRYFDGREWHPHWDSHTQRRLPNAVEVAVSIADIDRTFVIRLPQGT